jgi:type II secretory pathway pseudopilin PulG
MRRFNIGMTLVEIMMAVAILGAIILPIVGLLDYSNRGTREQDAEGIAANIAKEKMNQLLFELSKTNLLAGANTAETEVIKGNVFQWEYTVHQWGASELGFNIPQFRFHDPQLCAGGGGVESDHENALDAPKTMNLADVYPDAAGETYMADISLIMKWRLPNQSAFDDRNQFQLFARRTFLVTH